MEPRILLEDPEKSYHATRRVKKLPQETVKNLPPENRYARPTTSEALVPPKPKLLARA